MMEWDLNNYLRTAVVVVVVVFCLGGAVMARDFEWKTATPGSQGFDERKVAALVDELGNQHTTSLLVIRNDRIVVEWYADGWGPERRHYSASLAKAMVGGMSLLVAASDGQIKFDDPAWKYIEAWRDDPVRSKITIRQLATHSSGIEDAEEGDIAHENLTGWKGAFWRREVERNPFSIAISEAPIVHEPGSEFAYSNPGMAALAYAVTAAIAEGEQKDIRSLLRERIMRPLGVEDDAWSIGYGKVYEMDGLPLVANWGGGAFRPRTVARVGRLMMHGGNWEHRQLVNRKLVERMVSYGGAPLPDRSGGNAWLAPGIACYSNGDGYWEKVPRDAFGGAGAGNQFLLVIPSLNMIVVRNGAQIEQGKDSFFWTGLQEKLIDPLMDAVVDRSVGRADHPNAPYPASELIEGIEWAAADETLGMAEGSDNWPVTWGDDDRLYTAYGDGWGFEPKVDEKLSLGLCVVEGEPPGVKGFNIRSQTGEARGDGARGRKASGILMVDGVLYMWVRNAGNSLLGWSEDHGVTWEWAGWKFEESFGCPTFLNFGRNYEGARDEYVYVYSFDSETAYDPADRMVLARVLRSRLRERGAYEFFESLDKEGQPVWTGDIGRRGAVFENEGMCYRSGITYDAGLKRYLWCQVLPTGDTRFRGGFGVYEGEQPWGPWSTVYYTENWDMGPGESMSFPTKWMSEDGLTVHLVFSGDDYFKVRRGKLVLRD